MTRLFIANRGEIAIRIARAGRSLGMTVIAASSEDDAGARHLDFGDERAVLPGRGARAFLDIAGVVGAAKAAGAELVHPGYGFLSENPGFAEACQAAGMTFVGPSAQTLALLGDKSRARALAHETGVPIPQGLDGPVSLADVEAFFAQLEGGVFLKAVAGGGGRGARPVREARLLAEAFSACQAEAQAAFGAPDLYVEELIESARHVEVQTLADRAGAVSHLFERECTLQRSRQKLVEIAPSPFIAPSAREALIVASLKIAKASGLTGLATMEFLVRGEGEDARFVFIEANPRLQVEHAVSEQVTGVDLVKTQLRLALGERLADLGVAGAAERAPRGYAMQLRVNAETMTADGAVRPSGGVITRFEPPMGPGVRVDTHAVVGAGPNPAFDTLLAKVIVHDESGDFAELVRRGRAALHELILEGCETNRAFLEGLLAREDVVRGSVDTEYIDRALPELLAEAEAFQRAPASLADPGAARPDVHIPQGAQVITAPTSGVVVALVAEPGAALRAGAPVLVLEAMKMEHEVSAPCDGLLGDILVAPGHSAAEGETIAVFTPADLGAGEGGGEAEVDPDFIRPDLALVVERHAALQDDARPEAVARRRKKNKRTARENVAHICDPGTFSEYGALTVAAQRKRTSVEELRVKSPADGMVAGVGAVNGALFPDERARCAVMAYDYTVFAGTQGALNHKKKDRLLDLADRAGLPVIVLAEGGGGRPGETDVRLGLEIPTFQRFARLSGKSPLVGVVSGYCFAGNAALLGCADVIIATKDASIGMGGPAMIEGGGLGQFAPWDVGPAAMHAEIGSVDVVVEDEAEAVDVAKRWLSYFQGATPAPEPNDQRRLRALIPENRMRTYRIRDVIDVIADPGSFLETKPGFGRAMATGFVRIGGRPMGLIANDPERLSGAIDADAAAKGAEHLRLCSAHGLPVLSLCDTPGFMVGPDAEARGQVKQACRLFIAGAQLATPLFAVVLRKGYGLGAQAMTGGHFHAPFFLVSWPTGEFGAMGFEGAVRLGFKNELAAIADDAEREAYFQAKLAEMYDEGSALTLAEFLEVDDVIDPKDTRDWILNGLRATLGGGQRGEG